MMGVIVFGERAGASGNGLGRGAWVGYSHIFPILGPGYTIFHSSCLNPFAPKSDQFQIFPAAEIYCHTV